MKKILMSTVLSSVLLFGAYDSVGTDYDKAVVNKFTEEGALEALDTVNMILGFMKDSRASDFINKGDYIALLKEEDKSGSAKSAGTSSTTVEKLKPMTLNVTRDVTDPTSPMIVKLWLDEEDGPNGMPMRVIGYMKVNKGVDATYPLGDLTFNFAGYNINSDGSKGNTLFMQGIMNITKGLNEGQAIVNYKNRMNDGTGTTEASLTIPEELHLVMNVNAVDANGDGDKTDDGEEAGNGVAYTKLVDYSTQTPTPKAFKLSLSDKFYKVQEVDATSGTNVGDAVVREKANKLYKIYRYGVYNDSNGSKLDMNSGFPIVKVGSNNHGYIGYWGLWSENNLISNGDTVKKEGSSDTTTYTVVQAPGKLKKYTKASTTLEKIDNTKLYFFDNNTGLQYILTWDKSAGGGSGNFKILGTQDNYGEAQEVAGVTGQYLYSTGGDDNSSNPLRIEEWSGAWSDTLNANIAIKSDYTNATSINYHKEETVVPTSDMTLINYGMEILNPNMNVADINNTAVVRVDTNSSIIGAQYTFSATNLVLKDSADTNMTFPANADFNDTMYSWWTNGYQMGPFLASDNTNIANYNATNFWEVEKNEDVYYRWEVGTNEWNKYSGVVNNSTNQYEQFEAPKVFTYEHNVDKDVNGVTTNGGVYSIQYDGDTLQVPWTYDKEKGWWKPKINIKDGTALSDGTNTYRVKGLDIAIKIAQATTYTGTPALIIPSDLNSSYDGVDFNSTLIDNLGDKPSDANVTVIKGDCVKDGCEM